MATLLHFTKGIYNYLLDSIIDLDVTDDVMDIDIKGYTVQVLLQISYDSFQEDATGSWVNYNLDFSADVIGIYDKNGEEDPDASTDFDAKKLEKMVSDALDIVPSSRIPLRYQRNDYYDED